MDTSETGQDLSHAMLLTILVPVSERPGDLAQLHRAYRRALEPVAADLEFIYVLDGSKQQALAQLQALRAEGEALRILQLGRWFGEATALSAGFGAARGEWILTLPPYSQVEADEIPKLWTEREGRHMVVAYRHPRRDAALNRWLGGAFNRLVNLITGTTFHDLGCGVRLFRRIVPNEITLYGDQHRFFPVLATLRGFSVGEVPVAQSTEDLGIRGHGPGVLFRRLLDLVTVFFLTRFTKKPLRFFGLVGASIAALGALWTAWLVVQRLFLDVSLADRPALLLASLLIVLGVQVFALGLVGEIIIFTHARDIREYAVEELE